MPNWCTNRLTVIQKDPEGASLGSFVDDITLPKNDEAEYDLTLPYPPPEVLVGTRSPKMDREKVEQMRADRDAGKMKAGDKYVGEIHEPTGSWVTDKYLQECLDSIDQNEKAEKETGFISWYDWNITHWSTKWSPDVHSVLVDVGDTAVATISYQTAWSPAENLIKQLSELYPELIFVETFLEEGMGFWGANTYVAGECRHEYCGGSDAQLDELHDRYSNSDWEDGEDEAWVLISERWQELMNRAEQDAIAIGQIVTA